MVSPSLFDTKDSVQQTWFLEENERAPGEGPFTNLSNKSTRPPPQDPYSSIDVFLNIVSKELRDLKVTNKEISL